MKKSLLITCAARNAILIYPRAVPPHFAGAPTIMETTRTHEVPDLDALPEEVNVAVELYGRAMLLSLNGSSNRIFTERFEFISFLNAKEARNAFASLWRTILSYSTHTVKSLRQSKPGGKRVWRSECASEEIEWIHH